MAVPPPNEQSDATAEIKKIAQVDRTDGASKAASQMLADYQAYQKKYGAADANSYWNSMTQLLTGSDAGKELLPGLSIAWGKNLLDSPAAPNGTGTLDKADLQQFDSKNISNPQNNFNKTFADGLLANNAQLLTELSQHNYGGTGDGTADDTSFNWYLNNQISNAHNLTAMAPLFANGGALLKSLDQAANPDSAPDGHVSTEDVNAWLQKYDTLSTEGKQSGVYNQQNFEYVLNLKYKTLTVNGQGALQEDAVGGGTPLLANLDSEFTFIAQGHDGFHFQDLGNLGGFNASNGDVAADVTAFNNQVKLDNANVGDNSTSLPNPNANTNPNTNTPPTPAEAFNALPAAQQTAINNQVTSDFVARSTAQPGDGYIKIAERLLGQTTETPDVDTLYRQIESADNHARLYAATSTNPATEALTPQLLAQLNDPALTAQMTADRDKLVSENFGANS